MIKKRLVVKNGSYTNKNGEEKNSYVTIGHIHDGQYGEYITLESHINLAAFPRREGDTRVMINAYDVDEKKSFKGDNNDVHF